MDKAATKIMTALKASKVSAANVTRTRDLIDEAHDWDLPEAAQVEAVARYVCGVEPTLPKLDRAFLENKASELLNGLSKGPKLDAWDVRAFDVIGAARDVYWFWNVDSWLRERVKAHPKEPLFEEACDLLQRHGVWKSDAEIFASMFGSLGAFTSDDRELTSTGRWMLAQLDRDASAVFRMAANAKDPKGKTADRTSRLIPLLIGHRPDVFASLLPNLKLNEDSDKSRVAELLLEADAKRYEKQAVALMEKLQAPVASAVSALNLETFFPGAYPTLVKRLLLAVVKKDGVTMVMDDGTRDTKQTAYEMAWPVLGESGIDIWNAYAEKNDALRLKFFATIEKQTKAKALPWLIDGLCYPFDSKSIYGFVTHAKYVMQMLAILKPYDLAPYRERIEKTFAHSKDKKIREQIAQAFGAKPKVKAKAKSQIDPKTGFRFDVHHAAIVKAALAALKGKKLPAPIEKLRLTGMPEHIKLDGLVIEGQGDTVELTLKILKDKIPGHSDDSGDDKVLAKFYKLHDTSEPSWGDMYELPWCVLIHEQLGAAREIVDALKKSGVKFAKDCKIGVGAYDSFWQESDGFDRKSLENVAALPEEQQPDFAAVCFESPGRQRWLLGR